MIQALLFILTLHVGVNFVGWSLSGSQPAVSTALTAGITASDDTLPVSSVDGFPSVGGWAYIQGEAINYDATTATCPAPFAGEPACFTGASRGRQDTTATSHALGSIVYNEASGLLNDLSGFERRTSIDELGEVTTPWASGAALVRFLSQAATWDWPMFQGDFALFRVVGSIFTIAVMTGLFVILASILVSAVRLVRP
jgi:hypothetical protein